MQWEVDNQHIDVFVSEADAVAVTRWDDRAKIVCIPATMPKSEALWAIRNLLRQKNKVAGALRMQELAVFGRRWPIMSIKKSQKTYMHEGVIYSYIPATSLTVYAADRIRHILLQQVVFAALDKWEDFFSVSVATVKFRKNDKRPYLTDAKRACITFDSGLHRFTQEQINYTVFRAVTRYFHSIQLDDQVVQQHFPDRKFTEKILCHEYTAYPCD
jgi:hypothetical protein